MRAFSSRVRDELHRLLPSFLAINRDVLIREGVLSVLATLLSLPNGQEVQTEAAGATRNFTLDGMFLHGLV